MIAVVGMLVAAPGANAASPALEFVVPGHGLPVGFTTESGALTAEMAGFESLVHCTASHGEGKITGPRSTISEYQLTGCFTERGSHQKCQSKGASEEEIKTGPIAGDLVYIDQAKREVGILLNPGGGIYIAFECGGETAEGKGSFLAPVSPIDQAATSFTATLAQLDSVQTPDEYEGEKGERLQAIPTGRRGSHAFVPTGVEAAFTVHTSVPVEVKAITAQEVEAENQEEAFQRQEAILQTQEAEAAKRAAALQQQEEALIKQEAALQQQAETLKKQEAAVKKLEENLKRREEEASKREAALQQQEAALKTHQAEVDAQVAAAAKKHKEEEAAAKKKQARALRECEKQPKQRRARCLASVHTKGAHRAKKRGKLA